MILFFPQYDITKMISEEDFNKLTQEEKDKVLVEAELENLRLKIILLALLKKNNLPLSFLDV